MYSKGLTFLVRYSELRRAEALAASSSDSLYEEEKLHGLCIEQEVWFNLGRSHHEVGLLHLAEDCYRNVLDIAESSPALKSLDGYHVTAEAAHNIVLIYKRAGAPNLALEVIRKHLTF